MPEQKESPEKRLPSSLIVVVTLFFIHGTVAVIEMIVAVSRDTASINYGAFSLVIAVGLLLRSPWARLMAIVVTSLISILVLVFAAMAMNGAPATLQWFGNATASDVPGWIVMALGSIILVVAAWQLEVLMRPGIAKLFRQPSSLRVEE